MKKISVFIFVAILAIASFVTALNDSNVKKPKYITCIIKGIVYDSEDGKAEIYRDNSSEWVGGNITVYSLDKSILPAINNGSEDQGRDSMGYDEFNFDAGWQEEDDGKIGIVVGECFVNNTIYVFITDFTYFVAMGSYQGIGECNTTEWEPIPKPHTYLKNNGNIDLIIPNFSHPILRSLGISTLPNIENTIGFAVYRDNTCIGGTTRRGVGTEYFYTDPAGGHYTAGNYSVKPIVKGGFYGATPEQSLTLFAPAGGESLTGGYNYTIQCAVAGGIVPYTINLSLISPFYQNIIVTEITSDSSLQYIWETPLENTTTAIIQLNVTDGIGRALKKESGFFTIDSKSPDVSYTTPEPDATNVDLYDDITIKFNETMNTSSTENAILIEPEIVILSKEWSEGNTKLRIRHGGFSQNQTYLCRLTTAAKDSSLPGNNLKSEYSWSFKTTPNITASIKYPEDGKCYTGEKDLEIRYIIGRGIATYNITIEFFDGSAWSVINSTTQHSDGEYTFNWTLPKLDLTNAKLKLTVRDSAMPTFNVREKLITFAIDSTPPKVIAYTGSEGLVLTTEELWVTFSEPVNKTSVEQSFKLTKSITGEEVEVSYQWHNDVTIIIVPKTALTPETNYTAQLNITAKDLSIPGNYLKEIFSWEFVAALGQGDFMVSITFTAPTPARKGDKVELKVHLSNTGKKAFNNSGEVRVWFYEIKDGTKIVLEVKTLGRLQQGESRIISYETSFEEARSYNFLVVVESTNPKDLFNNKDYEWSSSSITVAEQPPSPVVAYTLIALMVILVIVIGSWVVISEKKKLRKRE